MLAWLAPIIVLGLVVFVHELGHFLAAKLVGVYAPRFSLGWGKPLWRWRPKGSETEYVISALPIGGYVRMASRDDEAMASIEGGGEQVREGAERDPHWDPEAMAPHGPKPVPSDRWFESKSVLARLLILVAGVTMNALLTIVVSSGIYAAYGRQYVPAVVDSVVPEKPAALAGFQRGDSIAAIDGSRVRHWGDVLQAVAPNPGRPLAVTVVRASGEVTLTVTPEAVTEASPLTGSAERVGKIGVGPVNRFVHEDVGLWRACALGWDASWRMAGAVTGVVAGLVRGNVSVTTLGGPIAIARTSVAAARTGFENLLVLIAFLSINLAVLNLLPIPILDGGQILVTLAEGARGKPFSVQTRERMMKAGLAAILLLFVVVMYNDLKALILSAFR